MKRLFITLCFCIFLSYLLKSQAQADHLEQLVKSEQNHFAVLSNYDLQSVSSNNFDVHFYRCEWTIDPAVRFISGSVTSHFTITSSTNNIVFDLTNTLTVDNVIFRGNKISFIQTPDNGLQINFPAMLVSSQKDSVSIFYKGAPPAGSGYFVNSSHSDTPIMWTLSEPYGARTWWPCKDVLLDKADSIDIIITNPSAYTSSSNGLPVSENIIGANKVTYWKHRYPIVAYLVAVAITNYVIDNDAVQSGGRNMPVVMYSYPESVTTYTAATNTAKFCLQNFAPLIGEYPFIKERYAQTQFGIGGGMEHQTNSFIGSVNAGLVAHELAHQWFGDKVTCGSWSDLWLNEGFASYLEYVYVELSNPANKLSFLQNWIHNITNNAGGSVYIMDTINISRLFDGRLTYRKGGYVLHMLRWKLGDSTFFRGVRRYINNPALAYKTARTADLQQNLEIESGQNLAEFFNDWVFREGHVNYDAEWSQQTNNRVRIKLNQTQSHSSVSFFEMPVPLQFKNATRDTILRVENTSNGQVFTLNLGFAADTMIIDPQLRILSKTKTTGKVASIPDSDGLQVYPNPVVDGITVSLPQLTNAEIRIFNSTGQAVYSGKPSTNPMQINAGKWASGVYWLSVTANNYKEIRKILIAKR
ncbi:MAG: M1 family aminopeptidase [Chitinophagaceae bacterium]